MPMTLADRIRQYAVENYIEPARRKGVGRVRIRAGDVHSGLGLKSRTPAVCGALRTKIFCEQENLSLVEITGPKSEGSSNNNVFHFVINNQQTLSVDPNEVQQAEPEADLPSGSSQVEDGSEVDLNAVLSERTMQLTPTEFEELVGELLRAKGLSKVEVAGRSGDGGIDGHCEIPFINVRVAFQAKRYGLGSNVGIEPVQRLVGSMSTDFDRGLFITTSDFTPAARGWVEEKGIQIVLMNGDELVRQMVDLGLGIKTVPVVRHEIDEGFFSSLTREL